MSFCEVTGHRSLLTLVSRAIAHESLPPSLIFAGPEGVGKRRVAVAVAAALNCQAPVRAQREAVAAGPSTRGGAGRDRADAPSDMSDMSGMSGMLDNLEIDACGTCSVCRRIGRGVHADVMMIAPGDTGAIKIDQIREATERAAYRPFEGRRRVVIHRRRRRAGDRGAERAAQDARRAPVRLGVRAGLGTVGYAGADGAVSLPAAAVRPLDRGRGGRSADAGARLQ